MQTEVEGVDLERRAVRTADGDFAYDHLVLVPGSVTNDFGIAGVAEHALPMKTLEDGLLVRKRILETVENAAREPDAERRKALLSFVVIGAGPVGVELATSVRDLMDHSLRRMYPELDLVRDREDHAHRRGRPRAHRDGRAARPHRDDAARGSSASRSS